MLQNACDYIHEWCKKWRFVVNCSRNKTEIIILSPGLCCEDSHILQQIQLGDHKLHYVEKSKVLGVIVDESLAFDHHAKAVLKNCWHAWYKLSDNTTRKRGLNTSSLTILFKTVVLTKLLYASPIWLDKNLDIFKDFMSRALLRICGAQFHPTKDLKEILLGIPPLKLLHEQTVIKFLLKCLYQGDDVAGRIIQIEATPDHPYNPHTRLSKEFLLYSNDTDVRLSRCTYQTFNKEQLLYSKDKVLEFTCSKWDAEIKDNFKKIKKEDPYNIIEPLHTNELLQSYVNSLNSLKDPLFERHEKRLDNVNLADFLHGHCLRFQDFTYSVQKADKTVHAPICLECCTTPDSPHHQVFECPNFQTEFRSSLAPSIGNLETNFHLPMLFHTDPNKKSDITVSDSGAISVNCTLCEARKALKQQVKIICEQSHFKDDLLTVNTHGNER